MSSMKEIYKTVTIDETGYPAQILINDVGYSLFCEYKSDFRDFVKVYLKDDGSDVVVDCGNGKAYVGMFSTVPGQIDKLFDFIEATISLKSGFDLYSDDLSHCLSVINNQEHPLIRSVLDEKDTFISNVLNRIRKERAISKVYDNKDFFKKDSLCSIEYLKKEIVQDDEIYRKPPDKNPDPIGKKVSPAKSLPEGWEWIDYNDGSGSLHSPNGKDYFSYDMTTGYSFQGGIEYRDMDDKWTVFTGSLSEFKEHVENRLFAFSLGEHSVVRLMRELADNAWQGNKPTTKCFVAGENIIELNGYIYEPNYEDFSATASLSFNGRILYGQDSRNVGAYRNEVYQTGLYEYLIDAISYIKMQTKGQELVLIDDKKQSLEEVVEDAKSRCAEQTADVSSREGINADKENLEIE